MTDQMSTDALELYCRNRAKSLGELTEYDRLLLMDVSERLCALQSENAEKDKRISRVEAERDAAESCIDNIEDDLDRGGDNDWARAHIEEWRGAQGGGMSVERLTELEMNSIGISILCNFPRFCGEERIKEASEMFRAMKDEIMAYRVLGTVEELARGAALVKAQEEGRVVVLPCKPSDVTVYQLRGKKHALGVGTSPRHISATTVWGNGGYALHHQGADDCLKKDFGKTWFLTPAEAEAALGGGVDEG